MPSNPNAGRRVWIAFLSLFVVFSAGAYFVGDLGRLRDIAVRENQTASQGAAAAKEAQNELLVAMATRTADETNAAIEKLSNDIAPPGIAKNVDFFGAASPGDLEALRADLKTAEANATAFLPRYVALLKAERDTVEKYARAHVDRGTARRLLEDIDKRDAEIAAFASTMLSARADFYRAYENYVAFLAEEFGAYKVNKGRFLFQVQSGLDRYNVVANAMMTTGNRVTELDQEGKGLLMSQQQRWAQLRQR